MYNKMSREGEIDGFDYYFYDREVFMNKMLLGEMFNVKEYGGNYYGSLEEDIDNIMTSKNIIFQITPDRALQMKEKNSETCTILILPTSSKVLFSRRKDRSRERIKNDIQNLKVAKQFDYVIVNDNIDKALNEIYFCINHFKNGGECKFLVKNNLILIDKMICGLNECIEEKGVEKVFKGDIAKKWDQKSEFVSYYGTKNPIKEEIMANACNGLYIADIGCGTGKMLKKIDSSFSACHLMGLDISNDMISLAQNRIFNGNNMVSFVNNDFMEYNFKDYYDIIIFIY